MTNNNHKFYVPESAMAIVAHPDDVDFGCAGTFARWAKAGARLCYVVCTSGDVGIATPGMTKARAIAIRESEQRKAARIAGVPEVVFLREPDGMLQATMELRRKLVREIRRFRPEAIFVMDPTLVWAGEGYINHPDHRAAGLAAIEAVFPAAGQPNLFQELESEGLAAFKPRKVFSLNWRDGDYYFSIDETIDIKIAALRAHKSQMGDWDPAPRIREWAAERAKGKEMKYAEVFRVVTLESDEDWEKHKGDVTRRHTGKGAGRRKNKVADPRKKSASGRGGRSLRPKR
ncbi:MAG TPA: PIG-L deacetylase family protein [Anaerolineales bacterium]|nr:PIG-L deacetylase family protein [Anaerolineales bacterium]